MNKAIENKMIEEEPANIDYSSKTLRQAAFRKECKRLGLTPEEIVEKANLFQGVDVTRFKLVRMPP